MSELSLRPVSRIIPCMQEWIVTMRTLPFCAFSQTRIDEVRRDQHYRCKDCGSDTETLQVHHIVPQRNRGTDRKVNAVALCPDCHRKWDALADEEVDRLCFDNPQVRQKIIAQFGGESS